MYWSPPPTLGSTTHLMAQVPYTYFVYGSLIISEETVVWSIELTIDKRPNSVRITRGASVAELDTARVALGKSSAVLMEAADWPRYTRVPTITFWHCFGHGVYTLGVCKSLIVEHVTGLCDAKNSHLSS